MADKVNILIVYSSKDDEALAEGEKGWVANFQKFLDLMLFQVLGEKPNVEVRSEKDDLTEKELGTFEIMIPTLSPNFNATGKCLDAVETYFKLIEKEKSSIARIFKVMMSDVPKEDHPAKLKDFLAYELFHTDIESGSTSEIRDFFGPEAERDYWMKLVDLAYDIHESVIQLKDWSGKEGVKPMFSRKSIFLAETSHDLSIQRNIIRRELQRHGYKVLPNHTLPTNADELEKIITEELAECSMSIHLIGNSYGEIPKGSDRSVVDIQNKIASEAGAKSEAGKLFSRLIWISPNIKQTSEKQKTFIENLKRDISSMEGAEILQTPLEDFKNIVREELIEVSAEQKFKISPEGSDNGREKKVYMLYDPIDQTEVNPIIKFVESSGYKVIHPEFKGELLDLRQHHIENLVNFDLGIIYYGKVNLQWVRMKLLDLLKAPGFGRNKPVLGRAIITGKGNKLDNERFGDYEVEIIDGGEKPPLDSIKEFLDSNI